MSRGISLSLLVIVLFSLFGCSTVRDGGGPVPSFDVMQDLKALETEFSSAVAIKNVYEGGATIEKRDKMIAGRLVMMNLRYLQLYPPRVQSISNLSKKLLLSLYLQHPLPSTAKLKIKIFLLRTAD